MKRDERNKIFFWAKMGALTIGLIFSISYQFSGIGALALVGLAFFATAFLMMSVTEIENLVYLKAKNIEANSQQEADQKAKLLFKQKLLSALKLVMFGALATFTVVVMFLF